MNNLCFQMRKCYGNNMWCVLLHSDGQWKPVFFVCSGNTPFKWASRFIGCNTASDLRHVVFNKKIPL